MKYQRYPKYKDSGIEWIGEIPEHWGIVPLFSVFHENKIKQNNSLELNVLSLSYGKIVIRNVESNFGLLPESFSTYQLVKDGNVILRLTDLQNDKRSLRVGLANQEGIITSAYVSLCAHGVIIPKFGYYLLHSYDSMKVFYNYGGGVRQSMNFQDLRRLSLIFPQPNEQSVIVEYIEKTLEKLDVVISKQQQLIELLKEKRQAVITHAVTKGLDPNVPMKDSGIEWIGEIPANWNIKRLKYAAQLVTEKSRQYAKRVALENVESWSGRYINTETKFEGEGVEFREGDVLFGKLRPYLAKVYKAEFSGSAVGEFFVLRPYFDIDSDFLSALLLNREFINLVDGSTYGAKMPRVDWEFMGNLLLAIPPTTEQRNIFEIIDAKTSKIDYLISKQQQMIELLQEHKTSLISQAVTGKIDVRSLSQEVKETAGQTP